MKFLNLFEWYTIKSTEKEINMTIASFLSDHINDEYISSLDDYMSCEKTIKNRNIKEFNGSTKEKFDNLTKQIRKKIILITIKHIILISTICCLICLFVHIVTNDIHSGIVTFPYSFTILIIISILVIKERMKCMTDISKVQKNILKMDKYTLDHNVENLNSVTNESIEILADTSAKTQANPNFTNSFSVKYYFGGKEEFQKFLMLYACWLTVYKNISVKAIVSHFFTAIGNKCLEILKECDYDQAKFIERIFEMFDNDEYINNDIFQKITFCQDNYANKFAVLKYCCDLIMIFYDEMKIYDFEVEFSPYLKYRDNMAKPVKDIFYLSGQVIVASIIINKGFAEIDKMESN